MQLYSLIDYYTFIIHTPIQLFLQLYFHQIPLTEDNWKVGSVDGSISTLRQFFAVLVDVTDLRFTLRFTTVNKRFI